jgi:DnaJ-class molecular chaperone
MDVFFGTVKDIRHLLVGRRVIVCNPCNGSGKLPTGGGCPFCHGSGER